MSQQRLENNTALVPSQDRETSWQPILHASNQVVLYNPTSHALTIHHSSQSQSTTVKQSIPPLCPYCSQTLPAGRAEREGAVHSHDQDSPLTNLNRSEDVAARVSNYFQLLQVANESISRPPSPPLPSTPSVPPSETSTRPSSPAGIDSNNVFTPESMAEGYFKAFFQEEARLGMGANGSVFLCQHVLNGNPLGRFAVKKIAVGQSSSYLLKILREVHLLETLRHPNIITYHHAWLESAQFSSFGPRIPTLHILMQWAEGGSLDDYIVARLGRPTHPTHHGSTQEDDPSSDIHSRSTRIRAFRAMQRAAPSDKPALRAKLNNNDGNSWTAVHLLSAEEVLGIFGGVAAGLGFLHDKSILHLDLKPGNVLLTWDEATLTPRAMLSDFGTSRDMMQTPRARSGNTGTLEYCSPESLPIPPHNTLPPTDSKSDMWSLGMILHKLIFFRLPYRWAAYGDHPGLYGSDTASPTEDDDGKGNDNDMVRLEREVSSYPGFKSTPRLETLFTSRRLPRSYLVLLESLLNVAPAARPSCEKVLAALHLGKFNPIPPKSSMSDLLSPRAARSSSDAAATSSLIPALRGSTTTMTTSPPSSPTLLPQLLSPPSAPSKAPPQATKLGDKTRSPSRRRRSSLSSSSSSPSIWSRCRWWLQSRARVARSVSRSCVLAAKIASLFVVRDGGRGGAVPMPMPMPMPVWALSMLVGLSIIDSLIDNVAWNLGFGVVHIAALKTYSRWASGASITFH